MAVTISTERRSRFPKALRGQFPSPLLREQTSQKTKSPKTMTLIHRMQSKIRAQFKLVTMEQAARVALT